MVFSSSLIYFFISLLYIHLHLVQSHCPKEFECGGLTLTFPFSNRSEPDCGLIPVHCDSSNGFVNLSKMTQIHPLGDWTIVSQNKNPTWVIPSSSSRDCNVFNNITLPKNNPAISFSTTLTNVTLLKCNARSSSGSQSLDDLGGYTKFSECEKEHGFSIYYNYSDGMILDIVGSDYPDGCEIIQWPIGKQRFDPKYEQLMFYLIDIGFPMTWNLYGSCKECYLGGHTCRVDHQNYTCSQEGNKISILLFSTVVFGVIAIFAIIAWYFNHSIVADTKSFDPDSMEMFLKNYDTLM